MLFIPVIVSVFAIIFAVFLIRQIRRAPRGSGKMIAISNYIREGAIAYLKRQSKSVAVVAFVLFLLLWVFLGFKIASGFLLGALFSAAAGFVGMMVSTQTNVRVAEAAKKGLPPTLDLAFRGGLVTGLLVVGLGLLSISGFYLLVQDLKPLIALGFGASLISLFARLGGGIYTKAADVGADLVGKIEKGIPEDDPRNPAVIADQVGDNVGDCAGMAADLFETYLVTMVAAMILGALIFPGESSIIQLPLFLGAVAILSFILASFLVKLKKNQSIVFTLYKGLIGSSLLSALGFIFVINNSVSSIDLSFWQLYVPALMGLVVAGGMFLITDYFTSKRYQPVRSIAEASTSGHATNIIQGLAVGLRSTALPVVLISFGILVSFWLGGMMGLAIAVVSMLSLAGMIVALDSYGPITDNASGIAEMAGLGKEIREVTDSLDAVGNTTKAVTKAYAITSAGLAALVLFSAYAQEIQALGVKMLFYLEDYKVLIGLFLGGLLPYLFASYAMTAVGKAGQKVVEEARRQFKEISGLMEGKGKPEYGKCVDIVTKAALKEMVKPALIPVAAPILVGFLLGPEALGGLLIGSVVTGIFVAISMTSGGAAWDNAKKYIEEGNLGGKGSFAHEAAITGDTVGDPYKDCAGPAINPMIKVLNIVALLIVGFLV
ncbi:MAG: sodium-translocating pyrophosphatase [Candidatus Nealsonbacteria bacterium]|nr:MAG: sodium-translocating pyrophosphatase [Candidatus Nealsonbacteria bacterium]